MPPGVFPTGHGKWNLICLAPALSMALLKTHRPSRLRLNCRKPAFPGMP